MKFLNNTLGLLVYVAKQVIGHAPPGTPVSFSHLDNRGDQWQILVSKVPSIERKVA